jgi:hypothetical protein
MQVLNVFAGMYMTLPLATLTAELPPTPRLQIFPKIGFALSAVWEKTLLLW